MQPLLLLLVRLLDPTEEDCGMDSAQWQNEANGWLVVHTAREGFLFSQVAASQSKSTTTGGSTGLLSTRKSVVLVVALAVVRVEV
jgi:hypothetical protein